MEFNIETLKNSGAFAGRPTKKTISWESDDGETHEADIFIRKKSFFLAANGIDAFIKSGGKTAIGDNQAVAIASYICDENGKSIFTPADITGEADPERGPLNESLTTALMMAISEEIGAIEEKKKESLRMKMNSGTNSSCSESAEIQLMTPSEA